MGRALVLAAFLLASCSDGGDIRDASTDTGTDPDVRDVTPEAAADPSPDPATDAAAEADGATTDGWIGAPCTDLSDCAAIDHARATCLPDSMEYPDGYCSVEDCDTGGGDCPSGSSCISGGGGNFCMLDCTDDSDCRTPCYHCMGVCMVDMAAGC